MLFLSWVFAAFFVITYAVHLCVKRTRFWLHRLLAASPFFYGWWNPLYLLIGLFKKVAMGDFLVLYADKVYSAPGDFDGVSLLLDTQGSRETSFRLPPCPASCAIDIPMPGR